MYLLISLLAYLIDMRFGEFKQVKHPIIFMGEYISFFEKHLYHDSKIRGMILTLSLLLIVWGISYSFTLLFHPLLLAVFASMFLAHKMLHDAVYEAIKSVNKKDLLSLLVSRDTKNLSQSDMNKALIETYSENLSDGVIAPLFYLLFFGFEGIVIYKAINTLDSMVGYKTKRYKHFGYFSAKLDDLANLIPSRITALLIMLLGKNNHLQKLYTFAKGHQSPNAGYPISAIALTHHLKLGGDTIYHGQMMQKPSFGEGKENISNSDIFGVLKLKKSLDIFIILSLSFFLLLKHAILNF